MQTCYRNVIRRHFPTLHDGVRRSEYSGFGAKQDKTQPCHYRSEERTLRKARKAVGERRVQDQRSRFARAVFLGALESHERAHPPYPIGQGLAEQSSKQGRQVLWCGRSVPFVQGRADKGTGTQRRDL